MATWNPVYHQEEEVLDQGNGHYADKYYTSPQPPMPPPGRSRKKVLCVVVGLIVLLIILICAIAIPLAAKHKHDGKNENDNHNPPRSISSLVTACSATLYPSVCYDSLSGLTNGTSNPQDLVRIAITAASDGVNQEVTDVKELVSNGSDPALKAVSEDCVLQLQDSLDSLNETLQGLASLNLLNLADDLADWETWMSGALTTQQTCVDSFDELGVNVTGPVAEFLMHANYTRMLLSNALAFVTTLQSLSANLPNIPGTRRLLEDDNFSTDFVHSLRRRLQQSNPSSTTVVVAKDGSGQFTKIQDALDKAPLKLSDNQQYIIRIKAGTYYETINVLKTQANIVFVGEGMGRTIISGSLSVVGSNVTTSLTATLTVQGKYFIGRNFTVMNTAGAANHQAVALRVAGDFAAFEKCEFLGYQDTLYTHKNRQFYRECRVVGTVDFIFGNAAVVLQGCQILASTGIIGQQNTYTASGRSDPNENTGISFQNCTFDGDSNLKAVAAGTFRTYLGRPWKPYARTIVMQSFESSLLDPAGWLDWNGAAPNPDYVYFAEYLNNGPGSATSMRVSWSKQITKASDALKFTVNSFIKGASWLPQTSILYQKSI